MTAFQVEVHQNRYLPPGGTDVHAIVTVTASGGAAVAAADARQVEVIVLDASGSMHADAKLRAALKATCAAVDALRDDVWFAVIEGRDVAKQVYPAPGRLVQASASSRAGAQKAVRRLRAGGGTAIGAWLTYTARLVRAWQPAHAHAILLTDGFNEEPPGTLERSLGQCEGILECDCRGVGADWKVDELRLVASTLLGTVDIIPTADRMEEAFRSLMQQSMGRHANEVALEVWTPARVAIRFVKQVQPSVEDITHRAQPVDDRVVRFPIGSWGDETRSYHVAVDVPPLDVDDEMLAARVSVTVGADALATAKVLAEGTDDVQRSTTIHPAVAHYTGQTEMADALAQGTDALHRGQRDEAERAFGTALRLAAQAGNEDMVSRISKIAERADPVSGTVRLRPHIAALDERILEAESTKTVPLRRPPA